MKNKQTKNALTSNKSLRDEDQDRRTEVLVRLFQLRVLQESMGIPLCKQILLTPNLDNAVVGEDGFNDWEKANAAAWYQYSRLMAMVERYEDENAILFNRIINA